MKDWPKVRLGDIARIVNGRAYSKEELRDSGKYRVLRVGNFFSNRSWYWSDLELAEDKYCQRGDLLYAWSASFGPRIWEGEKTIFHYHIWNIKENSGVVDRRFLYWWLNWDVARIKAAAGTGSTMMHVTKGSMESRVLGLPPLDEQKRIVAKLDEFVVRMTSLDSLLEQQSMNLDRFRAQAAKSLFEQVEATNPLITESQDLLRDHKNAIRTGPFGSQMLKREFVDEGIPVLGIDNMVTNNFNPKFKRFVTKEKFNSLSRFTVYPKDVAITIMGTCGRCAVIPENVGLAISSKHLCVLSLDADKILPEYYRLAFLYSDRVRSYLDQTAHGSVMDGLNMSIIRETPIPVPTITIQLKLIRKFEDLQVTSDRAYEIAEIKSRKVESLKSQALQEVISGSTIRSYE